MVKEVFIDVEDKDIVEKLMNVNELMPVPVSFPYVSNPCFETMIAMRVPALGGFVFRVLYNLENCDQDIFYVFANAEDLPKVDLTSRITEQALVQMLVANHQVPIVKDWSFGEMFDDGRRLEINCVRAIMDFLDGRSESAQFEPYRFISIDGLYLLPDGSQYEGGINTIHDVGWLIHVDGRMYAISRSINSDWHVVELDSNLENCSIR